jgi:hypothetical protein
MTFEDLLLSTCSPGSAAGPSPSASPAGLPTASCGPAHARANRTRRRAGRKATRTPGTSGPTCSGSSASVVLTRSLANRCRELLGTAGSMEFRQTWREKVTPSGRSYSEHTASGRRTSGSGCSGWPTCQAEDGERGTQSLEKRAERTDGGANLTEVAALASWPTPSANEFGHTDLAGMEARRAKYAEKHGNNGFGLTLGQATALWLAGWATPTVGDSAGARNETATRHVIPPTGIHAGQTLVDQVTGLDAPPVSPWATPAARDYRHPNAKSYADRGGGAKGEQLANQVVHSGPTSTSSPAGTARRGVLSPAHSRWLMGFPESWDHCSPSWSEWALIQSLLAGASETPEAVWRRLAEIALADCGGTGTPSTPK